MVFRLPRGERDGGTVTSEDEEESALEEDESAPASDEDALEDANEVLGARAGRRLPRPGWAESRAEPARKIAALLRASRREG